MEMIFMRKLARFFVPMLAVILLIPAMWNTAVAMDEAIPRPGMVTMVDLGARSCIPCKMMMPILEEVKKEYEGKAAVIFVDVYQNPAESKRFKISIMPTQIFFDKKGQEITRHLGFMSKKDIVEQLDKLLKE
jgi:thioredoxin 1